MPVQVNDLLRQFIMIHGMEKVLSLIHNLNLLPPSFISESDGEPRTKPY